MSSLATQSYETAHSIVADFLKPFNTILKYDLLIKSLEGSVSVDGRVFIIVNKEANAIAIIDVLKTRFRGLCLQHHVIMWLYKSKIALKLQYILHTNMKLSGLNVMLINIYV